LFKLHLERVRFVTYYKITVSSSDVPRKKKLATMIWGDWRVRL